MHANAPIKSATNFLKVRANNFKRLVANLTSKVAQFVLAFEQLWLFQVMRDLVGLKGGYIRIILILRLL